MKSIDNIKFSVLEDGDLIEEALYVYKLEVTKVYDGDTIYGHIDQGLNVFQKEQKFRLFGINTPEVRGKERPQGLISRDWLREEIQGKTVIIKTHKARGKEKKGKFGRWLAEVFDPETGENLNLKLVTEGLAIKKVY